MYFLIKLCMYSLVVITGSAGNLSTFGSDEIIRLHAMCTYVPEKCDQLIEETTLTVFVNCSAQLKLGESFSVSSGKSFSDISLKPISMNKDIADVESDSFITMVWDDGNGRWHTPVNESFVIRADFLGRTTLSFIARSSEDSRLNNLTVSLVSLNLSETNQKEDVPLLYHISVIRQERFIDHMFLGILMLLVIGGNVGMGCKVDLGVVKSVLKKPIAPVIGFCCQYIIMPLTAYGLVRLISLFDPGLTGGQALGLFAAGCAPGGSSSNMYTYLLNGDVSLSVTLTLISLVASLGMIPLYLFTLGRTLISDEQYNVHIPFRNIFTSLAALLLPVGLGLILQYKLPRVAKILTKCLRPFYITLLLFIFTVGVYSNVYIFRLITPFIVLVGLSLPYLGFLLSGMAAMLLKQPRTHWITIAIETGLQNTGIPIILLKFSLPQPEADISVVGPIVVAMFMPLPLWIAVGIVEARRRRHKCRKNRDKDGEVEGEMKELSVPLTNGNGSGLKPGDNDNTEHLKKEQEHNGTLHVVGEPNGNTKRHDNDLEKSHL